MTEIVSYPRLHVCLLDLAGVTGRKYGGAGFAIDGLETKVIVREASNFELLVENDDGELERDIRSTMERLARKAVLGSPSVAIRVIPPQFRHVGLGGKTAVLLGCLEGVNRLLDLRLSRTDLQVLSGRGGTSGVGINTFFSGGFVVDGGHPFESSNCRFLPSAEGNASGDIPPVIVHLRIPQNWVFTLLIPVDGKAIFGEDERTFFAHNTPLPAMEVYEAIASVYHYLVPSVLSSDLMALREALVRISHVGFKKREIAAQGPGIELLMRSVSEYPRCAVGMSSMGPLLYVISELEDNRFRNHLDQVLAGTGTRNLGVYSGRNAAYGVLS